MARPVPWHARRAEEAAHALATDPVRGLSHEEAAARLARAGPNRIAAERRDPWWEAAAEALTEPLVLLLVATAGLYALFGQLDDAVTILAVILAVATAEVINETRATRAIASLRALGSPRARVVRDGAEAEVLAAGVAPGDVVLLRPGGRVPADLRLVESTALVIDESTLTGESAPVAKSAAAEVRPDAPLADRRTVAFAGTAVASGRGRGVAVATGRDTELGRIADLSATAREPRTPLALELRALATRLTLVALALSSVIPLAGVLLAGQPPRDALLTGLALAFATIPEELPILITVVLGLGAYRLARQRAIVRRLRAAETLGSVSAIGTDKTGTLTENRMRVVELRADGTGPLAPDAWGLGPGARLLRIALLASEGAAGEPPATAADPTERALFEAAARAGLPLDRQPHGTRVVAEYPFDEVRKRMSVVHERDGERWLAVKGAPEGILAAVADGSALAAAADEMAARGLRVLAFAERRLPPGLPLPAGPGAAADLEQGLAVVGLAGLEDPPRPEVPAAIAELTRAGIRVLMLTGDHPATARAVARRVGIDAGGAVLGPEVERADDLLLARLVGEASLFARLEPAHKLRIVRALAARGEVVAVTGDGVNDAPALREAAIGVAMGKGGTDVAREAAGLVLADDNFATVAAAVRGGRALRDNLVKAVRYYLAVKVGLVASSLGAVLAGLPVPFAPVQIIVLELFMDLGASTAFVSEPPEAGVMRRPPRDPRRPFADRAMARAVAAGGLSLAAAVLAAYAFAQRAASPEAARTAAFAAFLVGHLVLAARMRRVDPTAGAPPARANRAFLVWAAAALLFLALAAAVPALAARLHLAPLPRAVWAVTLAAALLLPSRGSGLPFPLRKGKGET